jgi:hypothetical protein
MIRRVLKHNDFAGAAGYAVRPTAARALIDFALRVGTQPPDGHIHRALEAGLIGIVALANDQMGFMLNDHWADWNHIHEPNTVKERMP